MIGESSRLSYDYYKIRNFIKFHAASKCFSDSANLYIYVDQYLKLMIEKILTQPCFNSDLYPFDKKIGRILYPLELILKFCLILLWITYILEELIHLRFPQSK